MNKAQALAFVNALEARLIPCDALLRFDAAGNETWSVQLDPARVYTGGELAALTDYCATHNLQLTATIQQLGVV